MNIKKAYVGDKLIYDADMINENKKIKEELKHLQEQYDTDTHILQGQLDIANARIIELQKENEDKKTYEFGLIVGTKRERDWWQNKIREKIEEIKNKPNNPNQKVIATQIDASLIACLGDLLKEE